MSLYLCAMDCREGCDNEIDGVEVGSYEYFGEFRDCVCRYVEESQWGSRCPVLMRHSDCDGTFTPEDCKALMSELSLIYSVFSALPPDSSIAANQGREGHFSNLCDCFVDIDGVNLIQRLYGLCQCAVESGVSVYFQ
ncbi:MAG: hypothetical protein IJM51_07005 [Clostridia bacterium]|nr:hypothetical protein [Clostridia bacterium]